MPRDWRKKYIGVRVCVRVRACACVCVRVRVRARVCACVSAFVRLSMRTCVCGRSSIKSAQINDAQLTHEISRDSSAVSVVRILPKAVAPSAAIVLPLRMCVFVHLHACERVRVFCVMHVVHAFIKSRV
jgi:hypothetical protein